MNARLQAIVDSIEDPAAPGLELTVRRRLDSLTKPKGSLGRLEDIALWYAVCRGQSAPEAPRKALAVFCGDHGVTAEGVSAYPSEVTAQMAVNFARGGAAINVLCRRHGIESTVVDVGIAGEIPAGTDIVDRKVAAGTGSFVRGPAMTDEQRDAAMLAGAETAEAFAAGGVTLAAAGEMGIGNTTAAAALGAALTGVGASALAGPGAGLDATGVQRKIAVIEKGLALHGGEDRDPLRALAGLGGLEIAAVAGFYLGCAARRIPVVVDGFIATAAALAAVRIAPDARHYMAFGHESPEPGHRPLLDALHADPILQLGMRLGEGTGAALAMSVVESALALYGEMATFEAAGVSKSPNADAAGISARRRRSLKGDGASDG